RQGDEPDEAEGDDSHDLRKQRLAAPKALAQLNGKATKKRREENRYQQYDNRVRLHVAEQEERAERNKAQHHAADHIAPVGAVVLVAMLLLHGTAEVAADQLNPAAIGLVYDQF